MAHEERLIENVVKRYFEQITAIERKGDSLSSEVEGLQKKYEQSLVALSAQKLNPISQGLAGLVDKLTKSPQTNEDAMNRTNQSITDILRLQSKCLKHQWDHIRAQFQSVQVQGEDEMLLVRAKQEGILPPPLEDPVARTLYKQVEFFLTKQPQTFPQALLKEAAEVLKQVSACNYDTVIGPIHNTIANTGSMSEEDVISHLLLVEHVNLNARRLSELIDKCNRASGSWKKGGVQVTMARVIRRAIWNWIESYPMEFTEMSQKKMQLSCNPEQLFSTFDGWASSSSKKAAFWPTQTMLLILCPDLIAGIGDKPNSKEGKFLEALKKSLKSSKLADAAAICYVDIYKASTYFGNRVVGEKRDVNPSLCYLVSGFEAELKEKLFKPQTPFKNSDGVVDVNLMTDCLLASYISSHRKVMVSIFVECLKTTSPAVFRLALINTLLRLSDSEVNGLWGQRSIAEVLPVHAGNLRALFQECFHAILNADPKNKKIADKVQSDLEILTKLVELIRNEPDIAVFPVKSPNQDLEDIKNLMTGIAQCACMFNIPTLAHTAREALLVLHKPDTIAKWCPKNQLEGFWTISCSVISMLATVLAEQRDLHVDEIHCLVALLEHILGERNEYLQTLKEANPTNTLKPIRQQAYTKLEIALLVHTCSAKPEICSSCARSFGLLCQEADILYVQDDPSNPLTANLTAYRQLAQTGVLSTGRVAQQKAIRSLLRTVTQATVGNTGAWEEVYLRYQIYTQVVIRTDDPADPTGAKSQSSVRNRTRNSVIPRVVQEKNPDEAFQEWKNFIGFLCALGAVCLNQEKVIKSSGMGTTRIKAAADRTVEVIDDFIGELMELVVTDQINAREAIKVSLGGTLAPSAYPVLFKHLHNECKKIFGTAGQINISDTSMTLIDQIIGIVKQLLESEEDQISGTDGELGLLTDMEDLITLLLRFIRQLTVSLPSLQIKVKFCALVDTLIEKRQRISWRTEYLFRAQLVENIMEWTSEFSKQQETAVETDPVAAKQRAKLVKELDVAVMKACASLLKRLPLPGDDDDAKRNSFQKFFNFFTMLLTRCKTKPESVLTPQLSETTILALSFLVTSNIEHGLEYFISMGYHEDLETRAAFLKVLCNILVQGANFDAGEEAEDRYMKLFDLLCETGMHVVLALADAIQITEADKIATLLVRVFEAQDKTLDLMKTCILAEVTKTETANTLFRRNSMATKLLAAYCKLIGRDYLRESVGPQLRHLISKKVELELDPTKLPSNQNLETNCYNLMNISNSFLEDIQRTLPQCPKQFRVVCEYLSSAVGKKFPGSEHTAVAGFMFLRYLCPAIVAPDGYGVLTTNIQDKDVRRGLVLITKVLQNLANRVQFTKEPFMHCMNPWIEQNIPFMKHLLDQMAQVPEDAPLASIEFTDEQKEEDLELLHWNIVKNIERINRLLPQRQANRKVEDSTEVPISDRLTQLLAVLGPPPEPKAKDQVQVLATSAKASNTFFDVFMKKNAKQDLIPLKEIEVYYQKGKTKTGVPVFYYHARKFNIHMEAELFIYFILKTTHPFFDNPFALVIDLTQFGSEHFIGQSWCNLLAKVIPTVAAANLTNIYILNPNSWFKKFSKRINKLVARIQKKIVFVTVPKLLEFIPSAADALPSTTLAIERNVQATFSPVFKVSTQLNKKEVILRIHTDLFQVITKKEVPLLGQSSQLYDMIHIAKVNLVEKSSNDETEFIIKYDWGGERSFNFRSPAADQIIQQLVAMKDRYKLQSPAQTSQRRTFRATDVPGTLLNMSLLNITSDNYPLRSAAYNLLCAVCTYFSFSIRQDLLEAGDVCLPKSTYSFVGHVSKRLAKSEPRLTLEFLTESLHGLIRADSVGFLLVLDYIRPWLANLKLFCRLTGGPESADKVSKTREVINSLIIRTINEQQDKSPAVLTKVWKSLGRVPESFDLLIHCLMERAVPGTPQASVINTKNMNCIEDIVTTLAAQNQRLFAGKLIHQLMRTLEATKGSPDSKTGEYLDNHSLWQRIEILTRWLMVLSFDELVGARWYLPELLHIVIILFFSASSVFRASIHGMFVNIVHSLCTHAICVPDKLQTLKARLVEFHQIQFRLQFGLSGHNVTPYSPVNQNEKKESPSMHTVENVANALLMVLNCCTPGSSSVGTALHARWLSLTTAAAFIPNPVIQPRALVTMGVLCQSPVLVTEELIGHLLRLLQDSLLNSVKQAMDDLPVAVLLCLSRMFEHLRPTSKFFRRFFWLAAGLIQIHDIQLFNAANTLMETVVKALDDNGCFRGHGLSTYCMNAREGALESVLSQLDQSTGISFKQSFSFALSAHLLKGLRNSQTKTISTRLLTLLVELCKENISANMLGYLAALLPIKGDEVVQHLRSTVFANAEQTTSFLFNPTLVPDRMHGALLFTFLATVLKNSEFEHEQRFIFNSLMEGVNFMPDAFPVTFDMLVPKMTQILMTSQNPDLLDAILSITTSIFVHSLEGGNSKQNKLTKAYLPTIGFGGLSQCDQFDSSLASHASPKRNDLTRLVCKLIDAVLEP